ncbi:kinase-like domain-containing protein [Nemania sp. NC0429]|nr:kinase-like domain-containing protein [Nemania sp. NC0429]
MIFPLATCDLHKYMDQASPGKNPKYVSWLIRQLRGLTDALSKIHGTDVQETDPIRPTTGYHRDLKPENILFFQNNAESGLYGTLQISDFGLAKLHSDTTGTERSRTHGAAVLGTPRYAPPELLLGRRTDASASHDLWSFGCIILELLIWNQFGREGRQGFLQQVDGPFYRTGQTNFEIHDQVREWIERLESSELHPILRTLLGVTVNKLLVWDSDGRWTSAELLSFFSTL